MRLILAIGLAFLVAASSEAASVQARLIRASNVTPPATDASLKDIQGKLKEQFGYNSYRRLGAKKQTIKSNDKLSFDLGNDFSLLVVPKNADAKQRELEIEWYSGKTLLVRSSIKVLHNGHVFINGPQVGEDLIVLAISVHN
jgi:hypothetical protein